VKVKHIATSTHTPEHTLPKVRNILNMGFGKGAQLSQNTISSYIHNIVLFPVSLATRNLQTHRYNITDKSSVTIYMMSACNQHPSSSSLSIRTAIPLKHYVIGQQLLSQ